MGKRKSSESAARARGLPGDFGPGGAGPPQIAGSRRAGSGEEASAQRPYLAGGRPPEERVQRGARLGGDPEQQRQQERQERQERRPGHRGVGWGCDRSSRGRAPPLTRSWPCPPGRTRLPGPRPSGPGWCLWCLPFPLGLPLSSPPCPPPTPPPFPPRCWDSNHLAIRPLLRAAQRFTSPSLQPRDWNLGSSSWSARVEGTDTERETEGSSRSTEPSGQLGWVV